MGSKNTSSKPGTNERIAYRQTQSSSFLQALHHQLIELRGHPAVLPKSALDSAIDYTLGLRDQLCVYLENGHVKIDNNGIENAIRPTAIGKKNWLFIGREGTGERSAVIYTLIESAKRHGHEPYAYLKDLLELLPGMHLSGIDTLLHFNWRPSTAVHAQELVAS